MSASTPKSPASQTAPGTSKPATPSSAPMPPAPVARRRTESNLPTPLLQMLGQLLALALCLSLPGAAGIILVMLAIFNIGNGGGLLWIWIPMILFVETIAFLCAFGVWRELTGWTGPRDYQR